MTVATSHLNEADLVGTALGDLNDEDRARRDAHAAACSQCAAQLERIRELRPRPRVARTAVPNEPRDADLEHDQEALLRALGTTQTLDQIAADRNQPRDTLLSRLLETRTYALQRCPRLVRAAVELVEQPIQGDTLDPLLAGLYRAVFMHEDDAAFQHALRSAAHAVARDPDPEWQAPAWIPTEPPTAALHPPGSLPLARKQRPWLLTTASVAAAAAVALLFVRSMSSTTLPTAPDSGIVLKGGPSLPSLTVVCVPPGATRLSETIRTQGPKATCPKDSEIGASVTIPAPEWQTLVVVFSAPDQKDTVIHREAGSDQTIGFDPEESAPGRRVLLRSKVAVTLFSSRSPDASPMHKQVVVTISKSN